MAYKVSYKVVSEQGDQLKNISKEMDDYITRLNQIVSKLGNDELLQTVRGDLNKFKQQLEEEKTVLSLAGQIITDIVQNYSGVEKKSVAKVDKAKAHNRDFYKRPVAVASAGGASAAVSTGAGSAYASSSVNVSTVSAVVNNQTNINYISTGTAGTVPAVGTVVENTTKGMTGKEGAMIGSIAAAVGSVAAAGGAFAGVDLAEKKKEAQKKDDSPSASK